MIMPVFGTATMPQRSPGASSRGKALFRLLFGTATPPTDASVASSRGEEGFYRHFGTATLN